MQPAQIENTEYQNFQEGHNSGIIFFQTQPFRFVRNTHNGREIMTVYVRTVHDRKKPWLSQCQDCGTKFNQPNGFTCPTHPDRQAMKVRIQVTGVNDSKLSSQVYICTDKDGNSLTLFSVYSLKSQIERDIADSTFNIWRYLPRQKNKFLFENYIKGYRNELKRRTELSPGDSDSCSIGHFGDVEYALGNHICSFFDRFDIAKINAGSILDFRDSLNCSKCGKTLVENYCSHCKETKTGGHVKSSHQKRKYLGYLRAVLMWARTREDISTVPPFPTIKLMRKKKIGLSLEIQQAIFVKIPETHRLIFRWFRETGRRPGEVPALKVRDIDFEKPIYYKGEIAGTGVYRLSGAFDRGQYRNFPKVRETKDMEFPLSDESRDILKAALKNRITKDDDFVFLNAGTNKFYSYRWMLTIFQRARKAAGYPNVEMNQWGRHTKAQNLLEGGATMEEVSTMLGHRDLSTAQKNYATFTAGAKAEIIKKVEKNRAKVTDFKSFRKRRSKITQNTT